MITADQRRNAIRAVVAELDNNNVGVLNMSNRYSTGHFEELSEELANSIADTIVDEVAKALGVML